MEEFLKIYSLLITAILFIYYALSSDKSKKLEKLVLENKDLKPKATKYDEINEAEKMKENLDVQVTSLSEQLKSLKEDISPFQDIISLQESGFYRFEYEFEEVDKYKEALEVLKESQKSLLKQYEILLTKNSSLKETKVFKNLNKIISLALNKDVEMLVSKVKYNNLESIEKKIISSFESTNKLIQPLNCSINPLFLDSKVKELKIGFEFESEKQRIKEEQAEILAQMREEESARQEAEKARLKAMEEEEKYKSALEEAKRDLENKSEEEKAVMLKKIEELEAKLLEANQERERATSMAQITKAGHVYIISNIGSFGENVYKIGMTRRKDPMDRVKELGDASVPFKFDVHAMVFSEDAPNLENQLHKYFDRRRVNKVNNRKEFFFVNLEEIKVACSELGENIKLTLAAEAREYRESVELTDEDGQAA